MFINGYEIQQHQLSYDKIVKNTLEQSNEMTIRFINGLFGDSISLDAPVPYRVGVQMADTIRKTFENVIVKSEQEVGNIMTTNIVDTLPWTDYRVVFEKLEERGRAEGRAEGKAEGKAEGRTEGMLEGKKEIARKAFEKLRYGKSASAIESALRDLGISDEIIKAVREET